MMMYISYIQREITSNLSDAIRSGNMIKIGFSENYIFIDVFAYSDLVENIIKIIKGIIFSSKDNLKLKSNFILCRDYAIEEFLNFAKVDLRQKLNYKYFEFLTKNDSDFPPIYNYYEFKKENYENSTNTTKNTDAFNYLNFPILRGFILGYYEKEEAQKIYNIFHSNFSDNFLSTIDRANYTETKVNPISFMTSCLRRKMSTNISIETLKKISDIDHVLVMLSDQMISVNRFFERPDREKQFLYQLLMQEPDPDAAMANFREMLMRVNSKEVYDKFLYSGFRVLLRDDSRTVEETLKIAEEMLRIKI